MKYPKIYIITCDESQHILPFTTYLINKYFHTKLEIVILGYTMPNYIFPNNITFIELKNGKKRDKNTWFKDISNYLKSISDQHVIFMIDDMPVLNYVNLDHLEKAVTFMRENNSSICYGNIEGKKNELLDNKDINIYNVSPHYGHKTNLQLNIWNKLDLINILDTATNPVEFELYGYKIIDRNNKYQYIGLSKNSEKIINKGLFPNHQFTLMSESRNTNNIFVLGIDKNDIDYGIKNNMLDVPHPTFETIPQIHNVLHLNQYPHHPTQHFPTSRLNYFAILLNMLFVPLYSFQVETNNWYNTLPNLWNILIHLYYKHLVFLAIILLSLSILQETFVSLLQKKNVRELVAAEADRSLFLRIDLHYHLQNRYYNYLHNRRSFDDCYYIQRSRYFLYIKDIRLI